MNAEPTARPSDGTPPTHPAVRAYEERLHRGPLLGPTEWLAERPDCPPGLLPELQAVHAVYQELSGPPPDVPGFEVLGEVGRGGMGVVYLARHEQLGRAVALKVLRPWPAPDAVTLGRFDAEARAAARLSHPNVVPVFDVGRHRGLPYLAMEYVPGDTLASRLAAGPFDPRDAAALLAALARAARHAHENGVIHRDIKPANVILTADGSPKLTDFGLAKLLDADGGHTRTGQMVGTLAYAAPEQTEAGREVGPAADVYALGAVLYECLTGQPPLGRGSPADLIDRARSQPPRSPSRFRPGISPDLEAVCLKCLEKDPAHRYRSAADLADDLGRFLASEPTAARPLTWLQKFGRFVARRRRPLALAGLGLLTGLAVGVVLLVREYRKTSAAHALALEVLDRQMGLLQRFVRHSAGIKREEADALRDALELAERVSADLPPDHPLHGRTGLLTLRLGEAEERGGDRAAASRLYRQSADRLGAAVRARPAERDMRWQLTVALSGVAAQEVNKARFTEAWHAVKEARRHLAVLREADPARPEFLDREVALTLYSVGLLREAGDLGAAADQANEALALADRELKRFPRGHPLSHIRRFNALAGRAGVEVVRGDNAAAIRTFEEMAAIDGRLEAEYPERPTVREDTIRGPVYYAEHLFASGNRPADALRVLSRSIAELRGLVPAYPGSWSFRVIFQEACCLAGTIHHLGGDDERARSAFREGYAALHGRPGVRPSALGNLMPALQSPYADERTLRSVAESAERSAELTDADRRLLRALLALRRREPGVADRLAAAAPAAAGHRPAALHALAIARHREGRAAEAREAFREAEAARADGQPWLNAVLRAEAARLLAP